MIRFKKYLQEKVSKADWNDAMSDSNIMVGIEFEYYDDYVRGYEREERDYSKEELESLAIDYDNFLNLIKKNNYIIKPSKALADYWKDKVGVSEKDLTKLFSETSTKMALNYIYDELPNPRLRGDFKGRPVYWLERMQAFRGKDLPSFVGNNYEIVEDPDNINYKKWNLVFDGSLGTPESGCVEIVSPPISITKVPEVMKGIFKFIDEHGFTAYECGLHINLSYKGKVMAKDVDLYKLMLFMEEGWVYKNFPERERNMWTVSMLKTLDAMFHIAKTEELEFGSSLMKRGLKKTSIKKYWELFKVQLPHESHYNSISWTNIDAGPKSRVEVRWLGGKGYDKKLKEVIEGVGKFAHYLKLALDVNYKYKEYAKKLWRMISTSKTTDPLEKKANVKAEKLTKLIKLTGKKVGTGYYEYKGFIYKQSNKGMKKYMKASIFHKKEK